MANRAGILRRSSRNQSPGLQACTAIGRQCHDWHRRFRELTGEATHASIIKSMDGRPQFGSEPRIDTIEHKWFQSLSILIRIQ